MIGKKRGPDELLLFLRGLRLVGGGPVCWFVSTPCVFFDLFLLFSWLLGSLAYS